MNTKLENTREDATKAMKYLRDFIPTPELQAIAAATKGEEQQYFFDKLVETAQLIKNMPVTYEQEGKGDEAIVYLHYFQGNMDWYITEKDKGDGTSDTGQHQAYGIANIGWGISKPGYISIAELIENNIELDLHWTPKTIGAVKVKEETTP